MQPVHIDHVPTRIVAGGAPTVANDALRYMSRMFRMAVRKHDGPGSRRDRTDRSYARPLAGDPEWVPAYERLKR